MSWFTNEQEKLVKSFSDSCQKDVGDIQETLEQFAQSKSRSLIRLFLDYFQKNISIRGVSSFVVVIYEQKSTLEQSAQRPDKKTRQIIFRQLSEECQ